MVEARHESRPGGALLAALLAGLVVCLPLAVRGLMLGHDTPWHLAIQAAFQEQLRAGEWYPRWLQSLNAGLGAPLMFVYAPLPYLVAAVPHLLWGTGPGAGLAFSYGVATVAAALAMFAWLRETLDDKAAAVGAALYAVMPYHLLIDLYMRGALGEYWGFVFMPLALRAVWRLAQGRSWAAGQFAAFWGLLLMTHLFTSVMFFPLPLAYGLALSPRGRRLKTTALLAGGYALGAAIAAVYLLPAAHHQEFLSIAKNTSSPEFNFARNFVPAIAAAFDPAFGPALGIVTAAMAVVALLAYRKARAWGEASFWLAVAAAALFLLLPLSKPVWQVLPWLQGIQFPWRFHTIVTLAVTALAASAMARDFGRAPLRAVAAAIVLPLALAGALFGFLRRAPDPVAAERAGSLAAVRFDGLLGVWSSGEAARIASPIALERLASGRPRVEAAQGSAEVTAWLPREIRLKAESPAGCWLRVRRLYYPAWQASAEDGRPLRVRADSTGLIELQAPPGAAAIRLSIPHDWREVAGAWVSLAASILACVLLFAGRRLAAKPTLR